MDSEIKHRLRDCDRRRLEALAEINRLRAERDAIAEAAIIEGWQRIGEGEWDENDPDVVKRYFEVRIGHRCQEADTHKAALAIVRRAAGLEPEGR